MLCMLLDLLSDTHVHSPIAIVVTHCPTHWLLQSHFLLHLLHYAALRNLDPEEPVQSTARLCCFKNLEVTVSPLLLAPLRAPLTMLLCYTHSSVHV